MNVIELFAGAGGVLGGLLLGHRCVGAVEIEPYCQRVLMARQVDGVLPWFPIYSDIRAFNGRPYRGVVDLVSGGFPCQDISSAGTCAGLDGENSGLWWEFHRVVREIRPRFVFLENATELAFRGLDAILEALHLLGFNAVWDAFGACCIGAVHHRHRLWLLATASDPADPNRDGEHVRPIDGQVAIARTTPRCTNSLASDSGGLPDPKSERRPAPRLGTAGTLGPGHRHRHWWHGEPALARVAHGVADVMDRNHALGNGQVPAVHALAFRLLYARLMGRPLD